MNGPVLTVLDTTLRDGCQGKNVNFSLEDKRAVCEALDDLGIDFIEAGNPASNPKDKAFFRDPDRIPGRERLTAFGSTRRKNTAPEADAELAALRECRAQTVCIFGKSSAFHVDRILKCPREENLRMIADSVRVLKAAGKRVLFDAEHFFDGWKEDREYAAAALRAAHEAGADILCLCDTNGGSFPEEIGEIVGEAVRLFPGAIFGIHAHDDIGCAVAVSIAAVRAGCRHVQGTLAGFGERCGNTNLSALLPSLVLKLGYSIPGFRPEKLTSAVRKIFEISNLVMPDSLPYVGSAAFTHKAGMHADGVLKASSAFEHIPPEAVGNDRHFLLSEISGKSVLREKLKGTPYADSDEKLAKVREELKAAELEGYAFETAEASFLLRLAKLFGDYMPFFELVSFKTISEQPEIEGAAATAVVKTRVGDKATLCAAEGDGPVNALDKALKGALYEFYPALHRVLLTDYKVRVINPENTTAARVRVLISSTDGSRSWSTVGVSEDVVHASFIALSDSLEYYLRLNT